MTIKKISRKKRTSNYMTASNFLMVGAEHKGNNLNVLATAMDVMYDIRDIKEIGMGIDSVLVHIKNDEFYVYWDAIQQEKLANKIIQLGLVDHNFFKKINEKIESNSNDLLKFAEKLEKTNPAELSKTELIEYNKQFEKLWYHCMQYGYLPSIIDYTGNLTSALTKELAKYDLNKITPQEAFFILTNNNEPTPITKCSKNLNELICKTKAENITSLKQLKNSQLFELISNHYNKYAHLSYGFAGPLSTLDDLCLQIINATPENNLRAYTAFSPVKISTELRKVLFQLGEFTRTKAIRFNASTKICMEFEKIQRENAKRLCISLDYLRSMHINEVIYALTTGQLPSDLTSRNPTNCGYLIENNQRRIIYGNELDSKLKTITVLNSDLIEFHGQCAYPGIATGRVKIVNNIQDLEKFKQGDILISIATSPDLIIAMRKAAAIITHTGGVTCHAAVVARELKVPCIIGVTNIMQYLKDGDKIHVNATKGIVQKL